MKSKTTIYGVFDGGVCIYVGKTTNLISRSSRHRTNFGKSVVIVPFRECAASNSSRLERQVIRSYSKRGMATKNISCVSSLWERLMSLKRGKMIIVESYRERIDAFNIAARLNLNIQTRKRIGAVGYEIHRTK